LPEGVKNQFNEKARPNKPLTKEQKANNSEKAKKRCRVEHVFAGIVQMVGGTSIRCKSLTRAKFNISLMNLVYNMRRVLSITNPTNNWKKRVLRMSAL
jgi:IS5 family transposase